MSERLLPGAPPADDTVESTAEPVVDADVVDAEIVEDSPPRAVVENPPPLADRLSDRLPQQRRPRSPDAAATRPARSDFLSWRSAMTGATAGPADRRLPWPRLLGFLAGALLFVALVSLIVLVAL